MFFIFNCVLFLVVSQLLRYTFLLFYTYSEYISMCIFLCLLKYFRCCQKRKQFEPTPEILQTLLRSEMVSLGYFFRMSMIFFLAVELSTLGSPALEVLGRMERRSDLLFDSI